MSFSSAARDRDLALSQLASIQSINPQELSIGVAEDSYPGDCDRIGNMRQIQDVDRRHLFSMIIAGRCDRTFSIVSQRTALIRETVEAVVTENELIEERA